MSHFLASFFFYPSKNLQYILLNNTTYKLLYPTTRTIPFGAKNYVYLMATKNSKHEHSTKHNDVKDIDSTKLLVTAKTNLFSISIHAFDFFAEIESKLF